MLYVQHVDWRWIRQRPQALAELLGERFDVRVLHRVHPHRFRYPPNASRLRRLPLLPLPSGLGRRWARVVDAAQRLWVRAGAGRRPDIVWVTFPSVWRVLPRRFRQAHVVYDCMDDALGFAADPARRDALAAAETELVARASVVLCSSERLRGTLVARFGDRVASKIRVARNGLADRLLARLDGAPAVSEPGARAGELRLAYIGTIAAWMDFDVLRAALDADPLLHVDLYGPVEGDQVPHPRLHYRGVVAHDRLAEVARAADALVMPFQLTELIRAVDPVKLYEYLSFERPVIAVRYAEVERFAPLVHFYTDAASFVAQVASLRAGTLALPARPAVREFLAANTWERRAAEIGDALDGMLAAARGTA